MFPIQILKKLFYLKTLLEIEKPEKKDIFSWKKSIFNILKIETSLMDRGIMITQKIPHKPLKSKLYLKLNYKQNIKKFSNNLTHILVPEHENLKQTIVITAY
ncbi:hypothetical protein BpHYR1_012099 [Brachionus plicatilis]|uniref:Uncharacterized protein n=1 Tax=Brachionus plicatilis TaxID=10195 RepID=A0A3M7R357_BRAPC|nr:hypothetical protein BpHYR1_012099 [Brachionus plicatilis]